MKPWLVGALLVLAACQREQRDLRAMPPERVPTGAAPSAFKPGGQLPGTPPVNVAEWNAYALSEGKRLFNWYNCSGCHALGGGGMGPALMDDKWLYGSDPAAVFDSIAHGRPNGMPAWGTRIPEYQIWELAAYVRSLAGLVPQTAAPGRADVMAAKPAEQSTESGAPATVNAPPH